LPPLINVRSISKAFGAEPLFQNVSFTVSEGDRIGLIGPNGSGKSTLLRILAGTELPDDGEIAVRKRIRMSYVEQESVIQRLGTRCGLWSRRRSRVPRCLSQNVVRVSPRRWDELALQTWTRKRPRSPEAGRSGWPSLRRWCRVPTSCCSMNRRIIWTSRASSGSKKCWSKLGFACVVISHDRYFLENVATDMAELSRIYPDGLLRVKGRYSTFLEKKEEFLHAQSKRAGSAGESGPFRDRMAAPRSESAHPKIQGAHRQGGRVDGGTGGPEHAHAQRHRANRLLRHRSQDQAADRTARMSAYEIGGRRLFQGLNFIISAGLRVGLVGPNGSGKTTLLRLVRGEVAPAAGEIRRADKAAHRVFRPAPRTRSEV
jgi:ABC transport system ATP-binding/permease protein